MIWVLTGPECSGKTSLAQQLHTYLGWPLEPELARGYLNERYAQSGNYRYRPSDLLALAAMQERTEAQLGTDAIHRVWFVSSLWFCALGRWRD